MSTRASTTSHPPTSTSDEITAFYCSGKGPNERHSKRGACLTGNAPHNEANKTSRTLSSFKRPLVPKTLTTDRPKYSLLNGYFAHQIASSGHQNLSMITNIPRKYRDVDSNRAALSGLGSKAYDPPYHTTTQKHSFHRPRRWRLKLSNARVAHRDLQTEQSRAAQLHNRCPHRNNKRA